MTNKLVFGESRIQTEIISSPTATIAIVQCWLGNDFIEVTGTAKRDNEDSYDREIGEKLALGRALESLSKKLLRQANGKVKCAEDNRLAALEAAPKRAAWENKKLLLEAEAAITEALVAERKSDSHPLSSAMVGTLVPKAEDKTEVSVS